MCIEEVLRELKSSAKNENFKKSVRAELYCLFYLMERGFRPLFFREKFCKTELDLVCFKLNRIFVFEVKHVLRNDEATRRLGGAQLRRQRLAIEAMSDLTEYDIEHYLVIYREKIPISDLIFHPLVIW